MLACAVCRSCFVVVQVSSVCVAALFLCRGTKHPSPSIPAPGAVPV